MFVYLNMLPSFFYRTRCLLLAYFLTAGTGVLSFCQFDYECVMRQCRLQKFDKAIAHCHESVMSGCENYERASALYCLADIYRYHVPDDSLYTESKKKLVRTGYETQ